MQQSPYTGFWRQAREFFVMEERERSTRALGPARSERLRWLANAAATRSTAADDLGDPRATIAALVLYREAIDLLALAVATSCERGPYEPGTPSEGWTREDEPTHAHSRLAALAESGDIAPPPGVVVDAMRLVATPSRLVFDSMPPDMQAQARETLEQAASWLRARLPLASVTEIRLIRVARAVVAATVALAIVVAPAYWMTRPKNIALHKPVSASSNLPESVAPADGSGLVNGIKEPNYGIHTQRDPSPWVMVDLLQSCVISDVEVYNRGDGWFDEGMPMALELSENGQTFVEVARRTETFSQSSPWKFTGRAVRARFVRVRAVRPSTYITLSEIEVHGRC